MGINRVVLTGRLTRDPELRYTQSGTAVANFTLAVNRKFNRDQTDFIKCVAWRKTGEIAAEYLRKGSRAGVEGNIRVSSYEKDGQTRYSTEVYVDQLEFLDSKGSSKGRNNAGSPKDSSDQVKEDSVDDEDFPF